MNRKVVRSLIIFIVGGVCLGVVSALFIGKSWAAPMHKSAIESTRIESGARAANVELVGHFVGEDGDIFSSIVIQGNYAYVTDYITSPTCFHILDISDPANPTKVGAYTLDLCSRIDVHGSYVYVLSTNYGPPVLEMHIIDVSDPANPIEVGVYNGDFLYGPDFLAVLYPYVYLGMNHDPNDSSDTTVILDVTDPANPKYVKEISLGPVNAIALRDNYAYFAVAQRYSELPCESLSGFLIYDVSDHQNPLYVSKGSISTANDIAISGAYVYLAGGSCSDGLGNALFVEDISDPYLPHRVNVFAGYSWIGEVETSPNYLYLGSADDLNILSLANPTALEKYGYYPISYIADFKVSGGYIYATSGEEGLYIFRLTRSISGQITDVNQMPYPGVNVETSNGLSMTVGADGYYTFTNVLTGTYSITPTLPGYAFQPASRSLTVPSLEAAEANFTILPQPVSITLTPGLSTTLTLTDTQGLTTTLFFPTGAVSETMTLTLTPTVGTDQLSWVFAGHAFELATYHEGVLMPDLTFSVPVTVTIHYSDMDTRLVGDDSQLALWAWVGGHWQDAVQVCEPPAGYLRQEDGNVLSLAICRVGSYELMGPTYPVFLPMVSSP